MLVVVVVVLVAGGGGLNLGGDGNPNQDMVSQPAAFLYFYKKKEKNARIQKQKCNGVSNYLLVYTGFFKFLSYVSCFALKFPTSEPSASSLRFQPDCSASTFSLFLQL